MEVVSIGGCQSTGSSLLRQIINRHDDMYCFNESHLFCKALLYSNFQKAAPRLHIRSRFGLASMGWHIFNGVDLGQENANEIRNLVNESDSDSFKGLINNLESFSPKNNVKILLDKTPANVFATKEFLKLSSNHKVICTIRNPYDIMASLYARKVSLLDAVALVKSSFGEMNDFNESDKVHFIKYEDLILNSPQAIKRLCSFLGVEFLDKMLIQGNSLQEQQTKLHGWKYDETEEIGNNSINRFQLEDLATQNMIKNAFSSTLWEQAEDGVVSLMQRMGYPYLPPEGKSLSYSLQYIKSLLKRTYYLSPYNVCNQPLSFVI